MRKHEQTDPSARTTAAISNARREEAGVTDNQLRLRPLLPRLPNTTDTTVATIPSSVAAICTSAITCSSGAMRSGVTSAAAKALPVLRAASAV